MNNRAKKQTENTDKYGPLRLELSIKCPGYKIPSKIDMLGGRSKDLEKLGDDKHLWKSRKAVPRTTLNRLFKNPNCIKMQYFYKTFTEIFRYEDLSSIYSYFFKPFLLEYLFS